jgi:hypothetical protein
LGNVTATTIVTRDNGDFGLEFSLLQRGYGLAFAAQNRLSNGSLIKSRITQDLDLSIAYKKKFNHLLTATTSVLLRLKEPEKLLSNKGLLPLPVGFQFELNI